MRRQHIAILMLLFVGCAHRAANRIVPVQAVVSEFMQDAMHSQMTDGENDWCEWHDAVTFKIEAPPEWRGTNLVVYFPTDTTTNSLRHSVGKTYRFEIKGEYLNAPANTELYDGALRELRVIDGESNKPSAPYQ